MDFLRRLRSYFVGSTQTKSETIPDRSIKDSEPLARFLFDRKHFDKTKKVVKPNAFLPHGHPPTTSVFRIEGLDEDGVRNIGAMIAEKRGRTAKGRAEFPAQALTGTPLALDADDIPSRHANIVNWPSDTSERLLLAVVVAAEATLHLLPESSAHA